MTETPDDTQLAQWATTAKAQQWAAPLRLLLDITEPLSPLLAQMLWLSQPFARVLDAHHTLDAWAQMFASPDQRERFRRLLDDDTLD